MKVPLATCLFLLLTSTTLAQGTPDACHVYLIDQKIAEKAFDKLDQAKDQKEQIALMSEGVTILGQFSTVHGEEELTTKTFRIPRSRLIITASVFYTDETLPTKHGGESMLLALAVGYRPQESALDAQNNAVAEIPDSLDLDIARVKRNITVRGRSYLVGLQCSRPQNPTAEK